MHESPVLQASPSSQVPALIAVLKQPWLILQVSVVQEFPSSHERGVPPQVPALQVSFSVQALLSLHDAVFNEYEQSAVVGSQTSVVHGSPSSQILTWPEQQGLLVGRC